MHDHPFESKEEVLQIIDTILQSPNEDQKIKTMIADLKKKYGENLKNVEKYVYLNHLKGFWQDLKVGKKPRDAADIVFEKAPNRKKPTTEQRTIRFLYFDIMKAIDKKEQGRVNTSKSRRA